MRKCAYINFCTYIHTCLYLYLYLYLYRYLCVHLYLSISIYSIVLSVCMYIDVDCRASVDPVCAEKYAADGAVEHGPKPFSDDLSP